jgi:hypothetical protein
MATFSDALPLLLIVLALAAFVAVGALRFRKSMRERTGAPRPGPVAVPPEEIELLEGPVKACLRCGSTQVRPANVREGGIPGAGEMLFWVCGRCGQRGPAIEFADPTAYREFVKSLQEEC